jgi:hypothetical protein
MCRFTDRYGWRPGVYNPQEFMLDENFEPGQASSEMKRMFEEKLI